MRNVAVVLLALVTLPSTAFAQVDGVGSRTPLFTREAIELAVERSTQPTVSVQTPGTAPQPSWPRRHPVLLGTLIGAGISAGMAGRSGGINLAIAAGVGAGAGALVTGLVSTSRQSAAKYQSPAAATPAATAELARIKGTVSRLGVGRMVVVSTRDGARTEGRILTIDADRFVVTLPDRSATRAIPYNEVATVRGRTVSTGVRIGLTAGIVGGIFLGWLACYGAGGCGGVS